jgi:hypothetical protein
MFPNGILIINAIIMLCISVLLWYKAIKNNKKWLKIVAVLHGMIFLTVYSIVFYAINQ